MGEASSTARAFKNTVLIERRSSFRTFLLILLGIYLVFAGAFYFAKPWLPGSLRLYWKAWPLGACLPAVALGAFLAARRRKVEGRVVLGPGSLSVCGKDGFGLTRVRWGRVAAFADDSSDFVQLVLHNSESELPQLAIPTPTEETRVAVLDFLVKKGIPRRS